MFYFYANEGVPFIGNAITDPVNRDGSGTAASTCSARRTRAATRCMTKDHTAKTATSGSATATSTRTASTSRHVDDSATTSSRSAIPGPTAGSRHRCSATGPGGHVAVARARRDTTRARCGPRRAPAASSSRRTPTPPPPAVAFVRLDSTDDGRPAALPDGDLRRPKDPNRAWITYSGYQRQDADDTGPHFRDSSTTRRPATAAFTNIDGTGGGRVRRHPGKLDHRDRPAATSTSEPTTASW